MLAVNCALLEIAVDPGRLYDTEDPHYLMFMDLVSDRVNAEHRRQAAKAKRA